MAKKKIWEFPENTNPQPDLVFLVDENFTTQKISLSGLTGSEYFSKFLAPVSSGSYNSSTGCILFTTTSGATFNVCGFNSDVITGGTFLNNILTLNKNIGSVSITGFDIMTGLTVNGIVDVNGNLSATTYYGNGINLLGVINNASFDTDTNTITLVRNGGNILITGITDGYVTGFTYSNNNITLTQNEGLQPFTVNISVMTGLTINGNLTLRGNFNLTGDTNQLGNNTINGNLTVTGNTYVSGSSTSSGNVSGSLLISTQSVGNEGGEISLATPQINSTLSGGSIVFDVYQNRLRFFEGGGSNRGVYIDLTAAAAGVGTNLLSGGGGEPNSKGYFYMENNALVTPCVSTGTFYKVSGVTTTIPGYLNLFTTGNTFNRLIYNYPPATGSSVTFLKYNISLAIETPGNSRVLNIQLRRNNSPVPTTMTITTEKNATSSHSLTGIVSALHNDIFELYVNAPNNTNTDVLVSVLSLSLFT